MGPNAWSALGNNIGKTTNAFSDFISKEVDRRYKQQQYDKEWNHKLELEEAEAQEKRDKAAQEAAAAEAKAAQEKEFNQGLSDLMTKGVKGTRNVETGTMLPVYDDKANISTFEPETTQEEYYREATPQEIMAYYASGGKDFSKYANAQNQQFNQGLNTQKQTHKESQDKLNYDLAVKGQQETGRHNLRTEAIGQQNANAHTLTAQTGAKKAAQPTTQQKKEAEAAKAFKNLYEWAKANQTWDKDRGATLAYKYNKYKNRGLLSGNGIWGKLGNLAFKDNITDYNAAIKNIISEYEEEYF